MEDPGSTRLGTRFGPSRRDPCRLTVDAAALGNGARSLVGADNATQYLDDQARPIGRISAWFINFIETTAVQAQDAPVIYVEARRTFLQVPKSVRLRSGSGSRASPVVQVGVSRDWSWPDSSQPISCLCGIITIIIIPCHDHDCGGGGCSTSLRRPPGLAAACAPRRPGRGGATRRWLNSTPTSTR
jgi:hypothetical protein